MVERYTLTSLDDVRARFGAALPEGCAPRFNIAPLQVVPIRTASALITARWGLLPPWRGHGGKRDPHVVTAPVDQLDRVPLLRNAFKSQRCLVIADGFFLWRRTGKKPQPIWLHPAPDPDQPQARSRIIAFAGLAATHRDDGQPSFAIIVGPAGPHLASLIAPGAPADAAAPTAPIVIASEGYTAWLTGSPASARELLAAAPSSWRGDPVSSWVNAVDHDDATCVTPVGNLAQGQLF